MICPECQSNYREGFVRCADCDVALVVENSPEVKNDNSGVKWIPVCSPLDLNQVVFIKSLLLSEKIPFVIEGENQNTLYAPLRIIPMRVFVPEKYAQDAEELLKELR